MRLGYNGIGCHGNDFREVAADGSDQPPNAGTARKQCICVAASAIILTPDFSQCPEHIVVLRVLV